MQCAAFALLCHCEPVRTLVWQSPERKRFCCENARAIDDRPYNPCRNLIDKPEFG